MNNKLKVVIKYLIEVLAGTTIWCLLDYIFGYEVNVLDNLVTFAGAALIINLLEYFIKLKKIKNDNKE